MTRLPLLTRLPRRARLAAIHQAFRLASDAEIELLAPELLELFAKAGTSRARHDAARVIAELFCRLPAQARSAAACVNRETLEAAALSLDPTDPIVRRSQATLAGDTVSPALAERLGTLLMDADPTVAAAAEQAISALGARATELPPEARAAAERAVFDAITTYDQHRRKGVLLAGLKLLGSPASLAAVAANGANWLADAAHPAQLAIRSLVRRSDDPQLARAAMVWLRLPAQSAACRERLCAATQPADHDAALQLGHLLEHPQRAKALAGSPAASSRLRTPEASWTINAECFSQLSEEARRFVPRWISCLFPVLSAELAPGDLFIADSSPRVRFSLLREERLASDIDLIDLAFDEDAALARRASLLLARRRCHARRSSPANAATTDADRALARLDRSPHASVRASAHASTQVPHGPHVRTAWRLALRRDRKATLAQLRDALLMGPIAERVATTSMIRLLGIVPDFERDLCEIAQDLLAGSRQADAVLAAATIAALGAASGPASARVLEQVLAADSPDARVQSNAVEALTGRAVRTVPGAARDALTDRLIELKNAPAHRPRSTAALSLIRLARDGSARRDAVRSSLEMLVDDRVEHRLAGAWFAERTIAFAPEEAAILVEPVRRLVGDRDEAVRQRARSCARLLKALDVVPRETITAEAVS